jgi:hypothetical protein
MSFIALATRVCLVSDFICNRFISNNPTILRTKYYADLSLPYDKEVNWHKKAAITILHVGRKMIFKFINHMAVFGH